MFNINQKGRVSSFETITNQHIEFVSFFFKNGSIINVSSDNINHDLFQSINVSLLLFAVINIIGGEYLVVDANV